MAFDIEQTLTEQNPHWGNVPYNHAFQRLHNETVLDSIELDEIQIITGIRRCGKSTLLQMLINHLIESCHPRSILYINFDDPNYTEICADASHMYSILTTAEKMTGEKVKYLFLDEVQNMEAWEKYVKSAYDRKRFKKILVTGSNADLLNSDYATLLSGRYIETRIFPLSFKEILMNNGITDHLKLIKEKPKVLSLLDMQLEYGGFPRIHQIDKTASRLNVLKGYYETILLKDCIKNQKVRDTKSLTNLAHYLLSNIASLYSYNSLGKAINNNEVTVQNFIQIFQNAYFIHEVKNFSYSLKSQSKAKKKIYCIDNGLIIAASFKFKNIHGALLENLVYSELYKKNPDNIYFANESKECDFIIKTQSGLLAIQVCYQFNDQNRMRELNGLQYAMEKFSIPNGVIITYDTEEVINNAVQVLPFWKYFFL